MPKPIDNPELLTGQDKVELAAEETKASDVVKQVMKETVGAELAEMKEELRAIRREAAEAVVQGKDAETVSKGDPENLYAQKDFVEMFKKMAAGQSSDDCSIGKQAIRATAKAMWCLAKAQGNRMQAGQIAQEVGIDAADMPTVNKALGIDDFTSGGALLEGSMFDEVVPEFLSETAIVNDNAILRDPVNGQGMYPYVTSGPTTYFREENGAARASDVAFDQLVLTPNEMTVIVPSSRKMLASVERAAAMIEMEMRRSLAVDVDAKLIRGVGGANEPRGLRHWADSSNLLNVNGTVSVANVVQDLGRLEQALVAGDFGYNPSTSRFAISPRSFRYLSNLREDGWIFQQDLMAGMLNGVELAGVAKRGISAIPENLSVTDSSESEIYLYDTRWLVLAMAEAITLDFSTDAAYTNSSGTLVSAFDRHQAVWKLNMAMDFGSRARGKDIACLVDVDWS